MGSNEIKFGVQQELTNPPVPDAIQGLGSSDLSSLSPRWRTLCCWKVGSHSLSARGHPLPIRVEGGARPAGLWVPPAQAVPSLLPGHPPAVLYFQNRHAGVGVPHGTTGTHWGTSLTEKVTCCLLPAASNQGQGSPDHFP